MSKKWYVCYCEPSKAMDLVEELSGRGADVVCPWFEYRRRVPRRNAVEIIRKPLIGGIFFCEVDSWPLPDEVVAGVETGSVYRMLSFGEVGIVEDEELQDFRRAGSGKTASGTIFEIGDCVLIKSGPFKEKEGIVCSVCEQEIGVSLEGFPMSFKISPFLIGKTQA